MNAIKKLYAYVKLTRAIRKADELHAQNGERQYVIPWGDRLMVIDRPALKFNKKKGNISREISVLSLESYAFYYTPYRNGSGAISKETADQRRRYYFKWFCRTWRLRSIWSNTWWYKKFHKIK